MTGVPVGSVRIVPNQPALIRIHPADDVAVAVHDIPAGMELALGDLRVRALEEIPKGHKIALRALGPDERIIKYGFPIGRATAPIEAGRHVHLHNMRTLLDGLLDYAYEPMPSPVRIGEPRHTFDGFVRPNGEVGIRNEIWIIPTVGCVNKVAERLAAAAARELVGGSLEGVHCFPHPYGCSQLGDDQRNTQKLLAGLVRHPNAGGVLIIGLGCENNNLDVFRGVLGTIDDARIRCYSAQQVEDEFARGMELLRELAGPLKVFERRPVPVSKLRVGLKCGGSDAFSGITANPLLGALSDRLINEGATTLLTEVPEMFGAETILMNRCVDRSVFDACVRLINDFKAYFIRHGQPIYENPAPGNKAGGISTLEEKSLGCTQKGGSGPVVDVLQYGEPARRAGLNLVQSPGNDMVSVSALTAAGAHLVLFTTGRGTPLGGPVPTLKLSTTSELARRKPTWIDFDAGVVLEGRPLDQLSAKLFDLCLNVASGRTRTKNEQHGFREIAIFKDGVTV